MEITVKPSDDWKVVWDMTHQCDVTFSSPGKKDVTLSFDPVCTRDHDIREAISVIKLVWSAGRDTRNQLPRPAFNPA